mmetsp:Transcript_30451/g.61984  ORF Transcript_30451/g.61984 Transcript_30451/m.61984 type:complete len:332 (+) Transcript_30451:12-1007(+)
MGASTELVFGNNQYRVQYSNAKKTQRNNPKQKIIHYKRHRHKNSVFHRPVALVQVRWPPKWVDLCLRGNVRCRDATIYEEVGSCHEARVLGRKKEGGFRHFGCFPEATHGHVHEAALLLLLAVEEGLEQRRVEGPRAQRVDPDPFPRVDHRQLPRHGEHGAFRRGVRELGRGRSSKSYKRGRVDDAAPPCAAEGRDAVFAPEPHTLHVHVHGKVPNSLLRVYGIVVFSVHKAGVVEDHRDFPESRLGRSDHPLHRFRLRHIHLCSNGDFLSSSIIDDLGCFFCRSFVEVCAHDLGPLHRKQDGTRPSNSASSTSDYGDIISKAQTTATNKR